MLGKISMPCYMISIRAYLFSLDERACYIVSNTKDVASFAHLLIYNCKVMIVINITLQFVVHFVVRLLEKFKIYFKLLKIIITMIKKCYILK